MSGAASFLSRALGRAGARAARLPCVAPALAGVAGSRWYILLSVLPKVGLCLALRAAALALGLTFFSEDLVNGFSNSAIFVVAILMSGVLEDYKGARAGKEGSAAARPRARAARPRTRARAPPHPPRLPAQRPRASPPPSPPPSTRRPTRSRTRRCWSPRSTRARSRPSCSARSRL